MAYYCWNVIKPFFVDQKVIYCKQKHDELTDLSFIVFPAAKLKFRHGAAPIVFTAVLLLFSSQFRNFSYFYFQKQIAINTALGQLCVFKDVLYITITFLTMYIVFLSVNINYRNNYLCSFVGQGIISFLQLSS